jgi:hypothetical protein
VETYGLTTGGERTKVDLKAHKITLLAAIFDLYTWFAIFIDDFERPTRPKRSEEEDRKRRKPLTNA